MRESHTDLVVVNGLSPAVVRDGQGIYELTLWAGHQTGRFRDEDFGKPNAKLKKPILYKGGAEKILWDYGVIDRYELMEHDENPETGYFFYRFKCSLVKVDPESGKEFVIKEGYGSANTRESNTGAASGFDVANTKLKIAEKRSMVDAVLKLARLSSIFTQDIENDDFMANADTMIAATPESEISAKQRKLLFAKAADAGMSSEQAKQFFRAEGFASTKDIKQKDFDALCDKLAQKKEG